MPGWSITFVDETGSSATMRGSFAPGTSAGAALAAVTTIAGAAAAISGCIPVRVSVSYRIAYLPISAPGGEDRTADQGVFIFQADDADNLMIVSVAGISRSKLRTEGCFAGEQINLEDSDVAALTDAISSGIWTDPFGADITAAKVAYLRQVG